MGEDVRDGSRLWEKGFRHGAYSRESLPQGVELADENPSFLLLRRRRGRCDRGRGYPKSDLEIGS
jgi:hypothetical protein